MLFRRKLSRASFVLLSLSFACALGSGLVMRAYAHRLELLRPDGGPPLAIVATTRDIARGAILADDALEIVTIPARFAPPGAVRELADATGRIAVTDLAAGEIVTRLRLAGGGAGPTASIVPPSMRAVQVPVAAAVGAKPGDLVDVIATFGGGGAHTELAGEAIEVLRMDRGGGGGAFGAPATSPSGAVGLVLLVTPDQAERLAYASAFASLSIAVRGPDDLLPSEVLSVPATGGG